MMLANVGQPNVLITNNGNHSPEETGRCLE
jgi:hypothetical protein